MIAGCYIGMPIKDVYIVKDDSSASETHTDDLIETTLKSYTIPGGMIGINGSIRIKATTLTPYPDGTVTYRLKLGGVLVCSLVQGPAGTSLHSTLFVAIHNEGAENTQGKSYLWFDGLAIDSNKTAEGMGVNTANNQILEMTAQLTNVDDVAKQYDWTVEIRKAN